jgi:TrfA protein
MADSMSKPEHITPELAETLESFRRTMQANPRLAEPEKTKQPAKIIQLPLWPEPVRGAPNTLLRSAFFATIHSKKRRQLGIITRPEKPPEAVIIAAQNGDTIKYAGTQLNQYDADVFFEALHRARHHPLETECIFRGYDFLKAIRRQDGPREYEDLTDSLTRLRDGRVVIEWKINGRHYEFTGGLIASFVREKNSKLYKVTFSKEIRALFAPACWTQLEWEERMALKGKPLAQWLHGFYCSHVPTPFPLSVAYLHDRTGSTRTLLKNFRTDLKNALATLEKTLGWKATWDSDLLNPDKEFCRIHWF